MSKFLQATNLTWSDSTATSVFQNCPVIHCDNDNAKKSSWYSSIQFVFDKVSSLLNVDSSKINGERLKDFFC